MDLQLSNATSKLDFIANGLFEKNTPVIFSLILSIMITFLGPPLLFAIIWFERFGSDKKRTILNMFVNMNCWNCIALVILGLLPEIAIYSTGPLPPIFCYILTSLNERGRAKRKVNKKLFWGTVNVYWLLTFTWTTVTL